jgi:DNA-binding HxlR family transcriptional regulator
MKRRNQSSCPICYSLDVFGDRWTLLILRDMLIGGKRHYRDFLSAGEGIATNILADRLKSMLEWGLIAKADDPDNGLQTIYSPTAKAEALRPVLNAMAAWALRFGPASLALPGSAGRAS